MKNNIKIAVERYNNGEKYSTSTSIDEDTILAGYGKLDYDFEFPLPPSIIEKEFGTTSWNEYFENKGYYHWMTIHKETGDKVPLGCRMTKEQIENLKTVGNNSNFEFEKI